MRLKVLGCSGAEFPGHNAPGFLLDNEIAFDAGSITGVLDEKAQMKINNIFITHAHLDHIRSIPFLADNIIVGRKAHQINILSISPVLNVIGKHLFNSSMWPDFTLIPNSDDAILNLIELKVGKPININAYTITPYKVKHTVPAVGYLVEDKKERRFFYTGDTGPSTQTWRMIGNKLIHCLIIDVSFPDSMGNMAIRTGHLTPSLLKEEILKIEQRPDHIFITHPKPQYQRTIKAELDRLRIKNVRMLKDGDTILI
jgi:ribonuclease BN (tRNA processing enzyme)